MFFAILSSKQKMMIRKSCRWEHRQRSWISLNITSQWLRNESKVGQVMRSLPGSRRLCSRCIFQPEIRMGCRRICRAREAQLLAHPELSIQTKSQKKTQRATQSYTAKALHLPSIKRSTSVAGHKMVHYDKASESKLGQTVTNTKASGRTICNMAPAYSRMRMGMYIMETGRTTRQMEWGR